MKRRVKEDEKNEKIIRGLLKLPANRRCINCNSLGPQYACTSFWTFVCATCSGIHREFTHRVKSVSMATFTSDEVSGLRGGGNERAKEVYFKEWDPQRQSVPDNCNTEGLRKFIKHVYVDRRYTGEKSTVDGPSTPKMGDREDSYAHRGGLHRMPHLDIYEQHCIERSGSSERTEEKDSDNNYGERNPGYGKESQKHGERKRISAYFEVVDDRFRDHIFETTNSEANWLSSRTHNLQRRPSNQYKALDSSRPREVHSLRDILDKIPTLRQSEGLKEDVGRSSDGSVLMQRTISSTGTRHIDGNSTEPKRLNSMGYERKNIESPVNIGYDSEPASQPQQSPKSTRQPITKPTISPPNSNNAVNIDCHTQENQSKVASNAKNLDSLVPEAEMIRNSSMKLSAAGVPIGKTLSMPRTLSSRGFSPASPLSNVLTSSSNSSSPNPKAALVSASLLLTTSEGFSSSEVNHVKEKQGIPQPQCSIFPDTASQSTSHVPSSIRNLQSSQFVSQHIPQASSSVLLESLSPVHTLSGKKEFPKGHGSGSAVLSHSGPSDQKCSRRKEFPQHLFGTTYSSAPVQSPEWQPVQAHGMGDGLHYVSAVQVPTVNQPTKSASTFDLNNGTHLLQSPTLSSMVSCHVPQPNVSEARSLLQSSSLGSSPIHCMPAQSSPYAAVPFQPLSSTSGLPLSSHMGQHATNKLQPAGYQGVEVLGNNTAAFSTLNTSQHPGGRFSTPAIQRSSVGGNPFA